MQRTTSLTLMAFLLFLCCAPPGLLAEQAASYAVVIQGVEDMLTPDGQDLGQVLLQASEVQALREHDPGSAALLRVQAIEDLERFRGILDAFGYFKAVMDVRVQALEPGTPDTSTDTADPAPASGLRVVFAITPGPRFSFGAITISASPADLPDAREFGLSPGEPYSAQAVLDGRDALLRYLSSHGHPFPEILRMDVTADHAQDTVSVHLAVAPGPAAVFGQTRITGLEHVSEDYIRGRLPWSRDAVYNAALLDQCRTELLSSGLFSLVSLTPEDVDDQGRASVLVEVEERAPRTIRAGIGYSTDTGPSARMGWEHRTLLGNGEHFSVEAQAGLRQQELNIELATPFFLTPQDSFHGSLDISRERRDAFEADQVSLEAGLTRDLDSIATGLSGTVDLRYSLSREYTEVEDYGFLSLPASISLDRRNDLLDPTSGFACSLAVEPALDTFRNGADFLRAEVQASGILPLDSDARFVLAARIRYGALFGAALDAVPPHVRFYAGGASSVRGYAYQDAGELHHGDPLGGLSVLDGSVEARIRLSQDFGLMFFLDAGRAYASHTPDPAQPLFVGTGIGVRYFSFFGPISLDVGFPLNRRQGDDAFQIYFGLGQSF